MIHDITHVSTGMARQNRRWGAEESKKLRYVNMMSVDEAYTRMLMEAASIWRRDELPVVAVAVTEQGYTNLP